MGLTLEVSSPTWLPPGSTSGGLDPRAASPWTGPEETMFGAERPPSGPSLEAGAPREGRGWAESQAVSPA